MSGDYGNRMFPPEMNDATMKLSNSNRRQSSRSTKKPKSSKGIPLFTSYFRKKHQREAEKLKEEVLKVQVYEEKLKEVLQPTQFTEEEEDRLRELKRHKKWKRIQQDQQKRFQQLQKKVMPRIPESRPVALLPLVSSSDLQARPPFLQRGDDLAQRSMEAMQHHTWEQRISVVGALMLLLFISLHADSLGQSVLPSVLFLDNKYVPWYIIVVKDCGKFIHMSACSLIHFALCDISLIYAFESMELGHKTGPSVKKFYREKVHVFVAALSGGIVALSICKALLVAWYRMLRDLLEMLIAVGKDSCHILGSILQTLWIVPDTCLSGLHRVWALVMLTFAAVQSVSPSKWVSSAYAWITRVLTGLCISAVALLIPFKEGKGDLVMESVPDVSLLDDSNTLLSAVEDDDTNATVVAGMANTLNVTLEAVFNSALNNRTSSNEDLNAAVGPESASPPAAYWRDDAFETCRYLLTHSAVFLVAFLIAFNVLTKSYRYKSAPVEDQTKEDISVALSSIRTSETLAHDEHQATNLSMETGCTSAETVSTVRPTSITVTIPVSRESYYGGSRSSRGTSRASGR